MSTGQMDMISIANRCLLMISPGNQGERLCRVQSNDEERRRVLQSLSAALLPRCEHAVRRLPPDVGVYAGAAASRSTSLSDELSRTVRLLRLPQDLRLERKPCLEDRLGAELLHLQAVLPP